VGTAWELGGTGTEKREELELGIEQEMLDLDVSSVVLFPYFPPLLFP
jgi:hypothetical protein